jgi:cytochrome b subunit of formate dehydrogenase
MSTEESGERVQRFSWWQRFQHAVVILLFGVLLVTGMPQKWPYVEASRWIIDHLGGIFVVRWMHRTAGLVFAGVVAAHLFVAVFGLATRRSRPTLFLSMQDFRDAIQHLRYFVGKAQDPPRFGRFDYKQKFEYWGLIFGAAIMVASGVILQFPMLVSRLLPAELIPAAKVMHSNEALLAFAIILVWHMYSAHLNPEVFPADTTIFTGKIRKDRLKREHELEYEERFGDK